MILFLIPLLVCAEALFTAGVSTETVQHGVPLEHLMAIPLRKCQIVLLSYEVKHKSIPTPDVALADHVLDKLQELQIPLQYWVKTLDVSRDFIINSLNRNKKLGCVTFFGFLETTKARMKNGYAWLQPLPWALYTIRPQQTEHDFTILGFRDIPQHVKIKWTWAPNVRDQFPIVYPENLIFVRLSTQLEKYGTTHQPRCISAVAVGALRTFCGSEHRLCVDWYNLKAGDDPWWQTREEFYRKLARQSSYFTSHSYNFNEAKIVSEMIQTKRLHALRKLGYRGGLFPPLNPVQNVKSYGTTMGWNLHYTWQDLEIVERTYNGSLQLLDETTVTSQGFNIWPGFTSRGFYSNSAETHDRALAHGYYHFTFYCVDSLDDPIDFIGIFNPMDMWTWLSLLLVTVAMSIAFWRLIRSSMFSLVVIFFAQGDAEANARFNFLIVIWSLLGFLLTSGYSSMIASIFVVPPKLNHPADTSELYLKGYKLALTPSAFRNKRLVSSALPKGGYVDNKRMAVLTEYLKKLEKEAVILGDATDSASFHDAFVGVGKACMNTGEGVARMITEFYSIAYSDSTFFTIQKTLASTQFLYFVSRPGVEVLRGGTQLLRASGIMHFWEMAEARILKVHHSMIFSQAIRKRHPFYCYGYFSQVLQDGDPYIFSIRNAQGKMVFYFGLICAASALGALCIEVLCGWLRRWCRRKNTRLFVPRIRSAAGFHTWHQLFVRYGLRKCSRGKFLRVT